jgi:hypothetical protein
MGGLVLLLGGACERSLDDPLGPIVSPPPPLEVAAPEPEAPARSSSRSTRCEPTISRPTATRAQRATGRSRTSSAWRPPGRAARPSPERTLVVLLSDHGEEVLEQGGFGHETLYEEVLRVPLVVRLPHAARGELAPPDAGVALDRETRRALEALGDLGKGGAPRTAPEARSERDVP